MGRSKKSISKKGNNTASPNNTSIDGSGSIKSDDEWKKDDEIRSLKDELFALRARVAKLENELVIVKTDQAISSVVNTRLTNKIDQLETYSRRNCVVLSNVPVEADESSGETEAKVKQALTDSGIAHDIVRDIPYRGKLRRGKVTKFSLDDEYFSPTKILPDENFNRRNIFTED